MSKLGTPTLVTMNLVRYSRVEGGHQFRLGGKAQQEDGREV